MSVIHTAIMASLGEIAPQTQKGLHRSLSLGHNRRMAMLLRLFPLLALSLLSLTGCDESSDEQQARASRFTTSTKPAPNPQREALDSLLRDEAQELPTTLSSGPKFELYSQYEGEDIRQVTGVSGRSLLLVFTAPWCPHCKTMRNSLLKLAREAKGTVQVVEVDADAYPNLANDFKIEAVPTTLLYVEGMRLRTIRGSYNTKSLQNYLRKVLAQEDDQLPPAP